MARNYRCQFCNRTPSGWVTIGGFTKPMGAPKCTSIFAGGGTCLWVKF